MLKNEITIIGITGGSGSGKTTLAHSIASRMNLTDLLIIPQDVYYKNQSKIAEKKRKNINYDHPSAFDNDLLVQHLLSLKRNISVDRPIYNFIKHTRKRETVKLHPSKLIILEGIMILADQRLRNIIDLKIFVETDPDIRFIRRLKRDTKERGRNIDSVIRQYLETVKPMHLKYLESNKRYADIIISGEKDYQDAINLIISKIRQIQGKNKNSF